MSGRFTARRVEAPALAPVTEAEPEAVAVTLALAPEPAEQGPDPAAVASRRSARSCSTPRFACTGG